MDVRGWTVKINLVYECPRLMGDYKDGCVCVCKWCETRICVLYNSTGDAPANMDIPVSQTGYQIGDQQHLKRVLNTLLL